MHRFLFITERFTPDLGGVAKSATRLVDTLTDLGLEIDIVTWSRFLQPGEVLPPESQENRIFRVGLYRNWDMTMPHTLNVLDWLQEKNNYDAIWGHYLFPSGFLAAWFGRLRGLPSIISARGNDIDREMFPPGDFARLQWTLQNAQVVTAVSGDIGKKIELLSGRNDVVVLKNAVDVEVFNRNFDGAVSQDLSLTSLKSSLGIAADEVVLGFCGELREKKGQQFLLNALTTVRNERPACLLIIGEVRASQESLLLNYKNQYPDHAQRIIVTGHNANPSDVAAYLRLCDVYLQPSLWEGMPNALLEAMACGCCCIASDAGGIPEIISHGENGFLLPRYQLHKLGEAVLDLLAMSAEHRQAMSHAAKYYIRNNHSIIHEKQLLQSIIDKIKNPK